jgi:hypothetical protein
MVIHLRRAVEKRRFELNCLLRRVDINKDTKHQIKGALNEVDFFLKALDDYDQGKRENSE